ncbi:unnamed protein product [Dicrocoelium dendriticum]|nr:unnamed protein product [Dicrocoelium dendriticum]
MQRTPKKEPSNSHNTYSTLRKVSLAVRLMGLLRSIETYALVDSDSDVSLVQEDILREAGVQMVSAYLKMQTVNACTSLDVGPASSRLSPLSGSDSIGVDQAYCLRHLPSQPVTVPVSQLAERWSHLVNVNSDDLRYQGQDTPGGRRS